jgi:uncharacterized protein YxjI
MREKMFAIGDDFLGQATAVKEPKVNGKALRIRDTLVLESPTGENTRSRRRGRVRDTMEVERAARRLH